jgi:kynureninase
VPALCAGKDGIEIVASAGLRAIRARSQKLTALLVERARAEGLGVKSPLAAERRGGHVALDVPEGYAVCQALGSREIVVDFRPDAGLRIAPHFYNTEDEVVAAVRAVRDILDSREYERFRQQERKPG